ncbi:hypothetical protein COB11_05705 [Candidatus Aerophobetes bacterium]|uniref:Uncharacterized protein n=1 Tax=Aerophobetes bacterium TaxID=2030807 RepID=A0A2A4YFY2_UNCAE|nr:MAG: hypothetical protein COB11_05705 [Candidatus Aerophobetes bacterium]
MEHAAVSRTESTCGLCRKKISSIFCAQEQSVLVKEAIKQKLGDIEEEELAQEVLIDPSFPCKITGLLKVFKETQFIMATRNSPCGVKLDFEVCVPGVEEMFLIFTRGKSLNLSVKLHEEVVEDYLAYARSNGLNFRYTLSTKTLEIYNTDVICFFNDLFKICECKDFDLLNRSISSFKKEKIQKFKKSSFF